jgi:Xaa-Pro aminopeptidase
MSKLTQADSEQRISRLQLLMSERRMDGMLVTQNVGIYYFTGSMQAGYLFIPSSGLATYYVRKSLVRAEAESQVRIKPFGGLRRLAGHLAEDYPELFTGDSGNPVMGVDMDVLPAQQYLRLAEAVSTVAWTDGSALLRTVRSVKSAAEIACLERSAQATAAALEAALEQLREGMTELELLALIEHEMRKFGHTGLMRMRGYNQEIAVGMVASGEAAAEATYFDGPAAGRGLTPSFPQGPSMRAIQQGEPILIDIGCCIDGYVSDQTRTAVIGSLPPKLQQAYETAYAILKRTEASLAPGAIPENLYAQALAMAEEAGLAEHFMGYGSDQAKFLGHSIGLEVDEWPVLAKGFRDPLVPGMLMAVEPKFVFPGLGVVGIENTYLVTESGCRSLSRSPEKLFEVPVR